MASEITNKINPVTGLTEEETFQIVDTPSKRVLPWTTRRGMLDAVSTQDIPASEMFPGGKKIEDDYGLTRDQFTDNPELAVDAYRHEQQSGLEQFGNALVQAAVGRVIGGGMEGLGYIFDIPQYAAIANGTEKEFSNWFSELGRKLNASTMEKNPIYEDPTKKGEMAFGDWSWWMQRAPDVASTLSIFIPVGGTLKAASALGKAFGVTKVLDKGFNVAADAMNIAAKGLGTAEKVAVGANDLKWAAKGLTGAFMSRHVENLMEAASVGEEIRQLAGLPLSNEQVDKIKKEYGIDVPMVELPDGMGYARVVSEELANEMAAHASANTYKANWPAVIQDIPQYFMLSTPFGKATSTLSRKALKTLGQDAFPVLAKKAAKAAADNLGEGLEEMYQYVVSARSKELEMARAGLIDDRDLSSAVSDYMDNTDFLESGLFGALSAGTSRGIKHGADYAIAKIQGFSTSSEERVKDIMSWGTQFQHYNDALIQAEESGNETAFKNVQDEFGTDLFIEAAKNGNLGHMVETFEQLAESNDNDIKIAGIDPATVKSLNDKLPSFRKDAEVIGKSYDYFINKHEGNKALAAAATKADFNIRKYSGKVAEEDKTIAAASAKMSVNPLWDKSFQLNTEKTQIDNLIKQFTTIIEKVESPVQKQILSDKLENLLAQKEVVEKAISEIGYSPTSRKEDFEAFMNLPESDRHENTLAMAEATANKIYASVSLAEARKAQKNYNDPNWLKEQRNAQKKVKTKKIKDAIKNAKTPDTVKDIIDRAETKEDSATVKKVVNEAADSQALNTPKVNVSDVASSLEEGFANASETDLSPGMSRLLEKQALAKKKELELAQLEQQRGEAIADNDPEKLDIEARNTPVQQDPEVTKALAEDAGFRDDPEDGRTIEDYIEDLVKAQEALNLDGRYSGENGIALYTKEIEQITEALQQGIDADEPTYSEEYDMMVDGPIADMIKTFLKGIDRAPVNTLGTRVKNLLALNMSISDTTEMDREAIAFILQTINEVLSQNDRIAETSKAGVARQQIIESTPVPDIPNVKETYVTPEMDNRPGSTTRSHVSYTDSKGRTHSYTRLKIINGATKSGNIILPTKPGNKNIANQAYLDKAEIPFGTKVYIELTPDDTYFEVGDVMPTGEVVTKEKSIATRGYKTVIYKDDVVKPENRIVVGVLNTTEQKGLSPAERDALQSLREKLFEAITPEAVKTAKESGNKSPIRASYYLTTEGVTTQYSQQDSYNTPLDVLPKSATSVGEYAEKGGFILGYTNADNVVTFTGTSSNIPSIANVQSGSGEIIVGVPNPARPSDVLIIRAFKPTLNSLARTEPELANNFADLAIEDFINTFEDFGHKEATIGLSRVILLNEERFGYAAALNVDNLRNKESEEYQRLREYIMDSYVAINKEDMNKTGVLPRPYGAGTEPVVTNTILNKFIRVSLKPNQLFENTSLLVSIDYKDSKGESVLDSEQTRKQFKQSVKEELSEKPLELSKDVEAPKPVTEQPSQKVDDIIADITPSTVPGAKPVSIKDLGLQDDEEWFDVDITSKLSKNPKLRQATTDTTPEAVSAAELVIFKKFFPKLDIHDIEEIRPLLNEITFGGQEAWGAFYNSAVYLAKTAGVGTLYHEAFHAVFELSLNEKERSNLLKDAEGETTALKEEWLANKFMDYLISQQMDKSLSAKIKRFFLKLKALINAVFNNDIKNIEDIASRASIGYYKKSVVSTTPFADNTLKLRVANWTYRREQEAVDIINNIIVVDLINNNKTGIKGKYPETVGMTNAEVMDFMFKETNDKLWFHKRAHYAIVKAYNKYAELYETTQEPQYKSISDELYQLADAMLEVLETPDGKKIVQPKPLIVASMRGLAKNGIIVTNRGAENQVEDIENILLDDIDGTTADVEHAFGMNFTNKSARFGASQRIKDAIRYLPTDETNSFGFIKYADFDTTYNTLYKDLAGVTTTDEIAQYLNDLLPIHPEYQNLIDSMKDASFATDMLVAFSRAQLSYTMINYAVKEIHDRQSDTYSDEISFIVTDANRNSLVNTIISDWYNGVLNNSRVLSRDLNGFTTVDIDRAIELQREYNTIVNGQYRDETSFEKLHKITKEFGFTIKPEVFKYIETMTPGERSNIYIGDKSIAKIIEKFTQGHNPFESTGGVEVSEQASIRLLANIVKKAVPELFESNFINADGNRQFSHVIPTFLTTLIHDLHNAKGVAQKIANYKRDGLYKDNVILNELQNNIGNAEGLRNAFSITPIAGFNDGEDTVTYSKMNPVQLRSATLHMYFNNNNKTYSLFRFPPLSDSGNMLAYKFRRLTVEEAYDALLKQAGHEFIRIQQLADEKAYGKNITNYNHPTNASTETGYSIVAMFNGFEGNPVENSNRKKATTVLNNYFNEYVEKYYATLVNDGTIVESTINGKTRINGTSSKIDSALAKSVGYSVDGFKEYLKTFVVNDYLLRGQVSLLTAGDPAFYKESKGVDGKTVDYVKRIKEIFSPKQIPDTNAVFQQIDSITAKPIGEPVTVSPTYNSVYFKDVLSPSTSFSNEIIDGLVKDGVITQGKAKQLKVAYNEEKSNVTDAQAWITLPFYRQTMISYNRWTQAHAEAYPRLLEGKGTSADLALVMQPLKMFMYDLVYDEKLGRMMPIQHKNSEFLLLPQLANNNPKLKSVLDFMNKNNVDIANFESAVKAGLSGTIAIDDIIENPDITPVVHSISTNARGIQMETPEHHLDAMNLFGTQIRKLIIADLLPDHDYIIASNGKVEAKSLKGSQLISLYESIIIQNLKEAYEALLEEFTIDGKLDWKKVHNILEREGLTRGKGEDFEKAIAYVAETGKLALPLFHPMHADGMQSLLTSLFKNNVTKQKITGGSFIMATSVGLSRELKLVFNNDESRRIYEENLQKSKEEVIFSDSNKSNLLWDTNKEELLQAYSTLTEQDFKKLSIEEQERLIECSK